MSSQPLSDKLTVLSGNKIFFRIGHSNYIDRNARALTLNHKQREYYVKHCTTGRPLMLTARTQDPFQVVIDKPENYVPFTGEEIQHHAKAGLEHFRQFIPETPEHQPPVPNLDHDEQVSLNTVFENWSQASTSIKKKTGLGESRAKNALNKLIRKNFLRLEQILGAYYFRITQFAIDGTFGGESPYPAKHVSLEHLIYQDRIQSEHRRRGHECWLERDGADVVVDLDGELIAIEVVITSIKNIPDRVQSNARAGMSTTVVVAKNAEIKARVEAVLAEAQMSSITTFTYKEFMTLMKSGEDIRHA